MHWQQSANPQTGFDIYRLTIMRPTARFEKLS
jgi:hypothetical protein